MLRCRRVFLSLFPSILHSSHFSSFPLVLIPFSVQFFIYFLLSSLSLTPAVSLPLSKPHFLLTRPSLGHEFFLPHTCLSSLRCGSSGGQGAWSCMARNRGIYLRLIQVFLIRCAQVCSGYLEEKAGQAGEVMEINELFQGGKDRRRR